MQYIVRVKEGNVSLFILERKKGALGNAPLSLHLPFGKKAKKNSENQKKISTESLLKKGD